MRNISVKKKKDIKISAIKSFYGFQLSLPKDPNLERYNFVVIGCGFFRNLLPLLNIETNLTLLKQNLL